MGQAAKSAGGLSPTKRRTVSLTKAVNILKPSRNADSDSEYELESEEDASPLKGLRNMASMNSGMWSPDLHKVSLLMLPHRR